ncbi:MAG: antitoxin family protein, partial [Thermoanaerobaculia bacterium]|nr:antitoxin family protein [Thermoanaerobaculia bacterium]
MQNVVRAIFHNGKIEPLEPVSFPEGSHLTVLLLPDSERDFWERASQASLNEVWDNPDDDVYADLL